jgi:hypothetical protein
LGKGTKGGGLGDPQFIGASRVGYTPAVCSEELGVALVVVGNVPSVPGFQIVSQNRRIQWVRSGPRLSRDIRLRL